MQKQKISKAQKIYNLALQAANSGDYLGAEKSFEKVLKILPKHPQTLGNLAFCLIQQQKFPEKIEALLKKSISYSKDYKDGYINLIRFYKDTEQPVNALRIFKLFAKNCVLSKEQQLDQARILQDIGQFWDSYDILSQIIVDAPEYMEAHFYFANVALRLGDNENAKKHFQIVLDHEFNVVALNNLAMCYLSMRDQSKAESLLRESIEKVPQYAEAYRNLSMLKKFNQIEDQDIHLFNSSLESLDIFESQKVHLHFALGKAYDDFGGYEKAFHYYQLGNQTQRQQFEYSINDPIEKFKSLKKAFSSDKGLIPIAEQFRDDKPELIFIVGMPRSGTSLLEQILSSVESVNALGELTLVENQVITRSISDDFFYPRDFHQLTRRDFEIFRNDIYKHIDRIQKFQKQDNSKSTNFIIDKQPFNFWHIGLILQVFPEAKIIHSMRNPLDTCLSIYFQYFHGNLGFVYDLKEIGKYYQLQEQMMDFWKQCYPESIFTMDYQRLVEQPEKNLIDLFQFLGIEWSTQYLEFYKSKRPVRTLSVEQVRSPIYKGSVERWKNYQPWIGELIEIFA